MRDAVTIREATPDDAASLALVGAATFLDSFAGTLDGIDIVAHCRAQHAVDVYHDYLARATSRIWLAVVSPGDAQPTNAGSDRVRISSYVVGPAVNSTTISANASGIEAPGANHVWARDPVSATFADISVPTLLSHQ